MKQDLPMKLTDQAFASLVDTLENTVNPLGELCRRLWDSCIKNSPRNALGASLAALLQEDLLPESPQRLVAIYVLYDMIVSEETATQSVSVMERLIRNPLTIILFELAEDGSRAAEQLFLSHLLSHSRTNQNDLPMIGQISKASAVALWGALEGAIRSGASVATLNVSSLRQLWAERHPEPKPTPTNLKPVSGIVSDPEAQAGAKRSRLAVELGGVVTLQDYTPAFVRIPPPFLPITSDSEELRWIDPELLHEVIWDLDMGMKGGRGGVLRDIISRAIKSPIPEAQQLKVLSELNENPKLVHLSGLTPQKLPDLVNNNSVLATEMLVKLVSSNQMPQYLAALVSMKMNRHSMEVVHRLSSSVELPTEFMHTYISNCIRSCGNIPDKYEKVRMVRFVCVFLKTLIKNKTIDVQDLFIEVQAFCIEYSRYVTCVSTTLNSVLPHHTVLFFVHVLKLTLSIEEFEKSRICSDH